MIDKLKNADKLKLSTSKIYNIFCDTCGKDESISDSDRQLVYYTPAQYFYTKGWRTVLEDNLCPECYKYLVLKELGD